ncbi:MAG: FtsX-like permease family protein [Bacteroidales bacterium]
MNFPFFIAKRYFLTKKLRNVINIISLISVIGVTVGTMALVVVLSVFNGFEDLIKSTYSAFDPDIQITPEKGKTFVVDEDPGFDSVKNLAGVEVFCGVLEENALIRYNEKQYIGRVKGVPDDFIKLSGLDSMITNGEFLLRGENKDMAVLGKGLAYFLSVSLNFMEPLNIYVPERGQTAMVNPREAFKRKYIFPSGIFSTQPEYDAQYVIVPIDFARDLLDYKSEVTAVEIKVNENHQMNQVEKQVEEILGKDYVVKNRNEQHEVFYKVMQAEKWYIFLILTFILIVASFNIIGSLTMLIIDKKEDIVILRSLGASLKTIRRIFFMEGWMISVIGALAGTGVGLFICWLQETFGLLRLGQSGSFVVDYYPVEIQWLDVLGVFATVLAIGFIAAWYPVRYITRQYVTAELRENI